MFGFYRGDDATPVCDVGNIRVCGYYHDGDSRFMCVSLRHFRLSGFLSTGISLMFYVGAPLVAALAVLAVRARHRSILFAYDYRINISVVT